MARELELKAVVPEPARLRQALLAAGAVLRFEGEMSDRRFDRGGELTAKDQVLRVRSYHHPDGQVESVLTWKGPVSQAQGYKEREEVELPISRGGDAPEALLRALGYQIVHGIDRRVEIYQLSDASLRLETYPRMDPLLEVEGEAAAIERAIQATGIPRADFTADPLAEFVRRFESRTGQTAALALSESSGPNPPILR
ncbi:MAG TPA: class IV adenylate cyclase [Gemmatimonadales bacterium]